MDMATLISALSAAPSQHNRLLRLHTPLGPGALIAEQLDGWESVDAGGYRLSLTALSPSAHIDLGALVGQPVLLQLLTAESRTILRPLHGHVSAFERLGSNAGLARYRLTLEPWLRFLHHRTDSYVFQDMTVMDIVESVFADYADQGALTPAWRWDLADRTVYPHRSLTTQYHESDFAFVHRLLAEEGLFYWFEHEGDVSADTLGAHTLVIADHNDAFTPTEGDGDTLRFHRADASERTDSIQHWEATRRWPVTAAARASWDYRSRSMRPAQAHETPIADLPLTDDDTAGPYADHDRAQAQRRARQHLDALRAEADTVSGAGRVRTLAPGQRFVLGGHARYIDPQSARFICLRVHHHARNNFSEDVHSALEHTLGATQTTPQLPAAFAGAQARDAVPPMAHPAHPDDFYGNHFQALPAQRPWRPQTVTGDGLRRHPKPTATGTQTAIVVGNGNHPVHGDRDHRIKVQFHFQRGSASASGQAHPGGGDNAPARDTLGAWVRVLTPLAGDNFGAVMIPRVGQEVLVDFLEGDIDRPVVIAGLYNGKGHADAAHNQMAGGAAGASANAVAWFAGNAHPAVFSGYKTQSLSASATGAGGYNLLRFDDSAGQPHLQLATTQHHSTLDLGHLKAGTDNLRTGDRGHGAQLSTQASGAVRAGQGLLLSSEPGARQMSAGGLKASLSQAHTLLTTLADTAKQQGADLKAEPDAKKLPAAQALSETDEILSETLTGKPAAEGIGGGEGQVPVFGKALLGVCGADGLAAVTPKDQVWVSGEQTTLTSAGDLSLIAQGKTTLATAGGLSIFTHGQTENPNKPNQETGIALAAATGAVQLQASKNSARFSAQQALTLASTQADIELAAPDKYLLLTAAGAYIKLQGGNIELGAPGKISFKATQTELAGGKSVQGGKTTLSKSELKDCQIRLQGAADTHESVAMS